MYLQNIWNDESDSSGSILWKNTYHIPTTGRTCKTESMKKVTLNIPDEKIGFFMELMEELGFEVYKELEIPEEHKAIVRDRLESAKPKDMIPWEEARKQFTFKGKS